MNSTDKDHRASPCSALEDSGTDGDEGVTLVEVLEEEAQLQEDADAVLGGSDDQNCTYNLGYVKRQALYACLSCMKTNGADKLAGICLACSYHCHDGHELIELYTKRNFCCDCGNSKFPNKCSLTVDKAPINDKNVYNHNFEGLYCTCQKPYPDPEDSNPDDMIQCVICEDWLHSKHLGRAPPTDSNYSEMICDKCMNRHSFLSAYEGITEEPPTIVAIPQQGPTLDCWLERKSGEKKDDPALKSLATYWPEGWRQRLCHCAKCLDLYSSNKLSFLTDKQDTVESYEQKGKDEVVKRPSHNDQLMAALSSLDRVQQVEAITEYQSFSTELKDYLKKFADNKKIVRPEDITEFFSKLKERKKRRLDSGNGAPAHFCR